MNFIKLLVWIAGVFIAVALMIMVANASWSKQETYECKSWADDAGKYQGYYILQWQKDQCDVYKIFINAPVK